MKNNLKTAAMALSFVFAVSAAPKAQAYNASAKYVQNTMACQMDGICHTIKTNVADKMPRKNILDVFGAVAMLGVAGVAYRKCRKTLSQVPYIG